MVNTVTDIKNENELANVLAEADEYIPLTRDEEAQLLTDIVKLKQHLAKIAARGCQTKPTSSVTCAEAGLPTPCNACYALEVLKADESQNTSREPFNLHIDGITGQPSMVIHIGRTDDAYPFTSDDGQPRVVMQEALVRFMGVMIDAYKSDEAFKLAAAKWGLTFDVSTGGVTLPGTDVA